MIFYVGNPPRQMLIMSGIVRAFWNSRLKYDTEEVFVRLQQDKPPGDYPKDWEYTLTICLSGIDSQGQDFTFTADECELRVNPDNDELTLWARIGVLGEDPEAVLRTFSYHIEVISKTPILGAIFGTIRWAESLGAPHVSGPAPMFKVGPTIFTPSVGWSWVPEFTVETSITPVLGGGEWAVPYAIFNLPLDTPLNIMPDLIAGALDGPPPQFGSGTVAFSPPMRSITLTTSQPSLTEVNFEMTFQAVR
jgi:hypothetical protein